MSSNSELYLQLLDCIAERTTSGKLDWVLERPTLPCMTPGKLNGIPCDWTTYFASIGAFQYSIVRYTDARFDEPTVIGFGFALINGEGTLLDWSTFTDPDNPLFELLDTLFKTIRNRQAQPEGGLAQALESAIQATKIPTKSLCQDGSEMTVEQALAVNMPFGRYIGYTLAEVADMNVSYINWLTQINAYGDLGRAIPILAEHFKDKIASLPNWNWSDEFNGDGPFDDPRG